MVPGPNCCGQKGKIKIDLNSWKKSCRTVWLKNNVRLIMRSMSEILKIRICIPGLKPRPREKRAPWVLRHCPESRRDVAEMVFIFAGLFAKLILFAAGLIGIFLIPLFLAAQHPDAPVAVPIKWLRAHFSHDRAFLVYTLIWGFIVGILIYATIVFDYLREHRKRSSGTSEPDKSDVA
jgi:hypothetical protein